MRQKEDVLIVEILYCKNCAYERDEGDGGLHGKKCPYCGKTLFKKTKVKQI